MTKRKKIKLGERVKYLYEWIEEEFLFDQASRFSRFCELKGLDKTDLIPEVDFLALKEEFES